MLGWLRQKWLSWKLAYLEENGRAAQVRVESYTLQESVQRMRSPLGKVDAESVPAHVGHVVLLRQRRDRDGRVLAT
jgi:hypothetical protein